MAPRSASPPALDPGFVRRTLFVVAVVLAALVAWRLTHVLLLLFGAVLIAVLLRTLAEPLHRWARLPVRWAVFAALVMVLGVLGLAGWTFGREVSAQVDVLGDRLPAAWETAQARLGQLPWGDRLIERAEQLLPSGADGAEPDAEPAPLPQPAPGMFADARAMAAAVFTGLAELLLVVVAGIFLALNPRSYRAGVLRLAPTETGRERLGCAFDVSGEGLRRWLIGQLISMGIVGLLVGLGTWAIGLPSPLALGLVAGLLEFVPILGPTLAAVPALLLALAQGPEAVAWTVLLYVAVQQVEGNLIMPLLQKRMVSLPPVLTLFAILSFGALFGAIGVLFATPLAVLGYLLVRTLYLDESLDQALGNGG